MTATANHLALSAGVGVAALFLFLCGLGWALMRPAGQRMPSAGHAGPSLPLELALGVVPAGVALGLFFVGFRGYVDAQVAPGDAVEITATAQDWRWRFGYPSGESSEDALRVPANRPVHVTVVSRDLLHRLELPAVHASAEANPGQDGSLWFTAGAPGGSPLLCGPTCSGHPEMVSTLEVLDDQGWRDFNDDGSKLPPAEYGKKLYTKMTCVTCHSLDGKPGTAPSFKGLFGKREALTDGASVLVDEAYLKESITTPTAKVVRGFQPVMPVFGGQLDDQQLAALIAFIKEQKP